jgi:hypothetical protein
MEKQAGRPEDEPDDEFYVLPPTPNIDPPKKVKGIPDFERETGRDDDKIEPNLDELVLHPYKDPPPKSLVNMDMAPDRWPSDPEDELFDIKHVDLDHIYDAVEPDPKAVDFDRYKGRESPEFDEEIYVVNL